MGILDKFIKVRDGAKIFVKIMGSGEPLLLIHGNGDDFSFFEKQIIAFKKDFKVIAMDTRGHGKSDKNYSLNSNIYDCKAIISNITKSFPTIKGGGGKNKGNIKLDKTYNKDKLVELIKKGIDNNNE